MKKFLLFLLPFTILFSCAGEAPEDTESGESNGNGENNMEMNENLSEVEMKVLSFSVDDKSVDVEVINRLAEAIAKIEGDFMFRDTEGNAVEDLFGNPKTVRFSKNQSPILVDANSTVTFSLKCRVPKEAVHVDIVNGEVKTTSKEKISL